MSEGRKKSQYFCIVMLEAGKAPLTDLLILELSINQSSAIIHV